ncbi:hypothetical protein Ciccas_012191 [Cichlidogyrus casuarinus]|uniref:Uncharacterized protein n=1 Tax=Cichlidogyrus casuarinus TaxID=1844966 RepID=A0ABD2PP34_9PLAT
MILLFLLAFPLFPLARPFSHEVSTTKLQLIPSLLSLTGPDGPIFNEHTCDGQWKYSLKLHKYDFLCSKHGDCLKYDELGYMLYFPGITLDITGSYREISERLNNQTMWFNLRIEKPGQDEHFYDFNFPIQFNWTQSKDPLAGLNEFASLDVSSHMLG